MSIVTESYDEQAKLWPRSGRHILAQFDADTILVYQAYRPAIGRFAVEHQWFGGEFSFSRMSWIKPNFLWMMYRLGWGTKENQEMTLGLRIRRTFFDELLTGTVASTWNRAIYPTEKDWAQAVSESSVRLQWDPDHSPTGAKLERRAIQLGLRGPVLERFGKDELLEVIDLSELVASQRGRLQAESDASIQTPRERAYRPSSPEIAAHLRLDD